MWHSITEFLLSAHASGLGHDAVIEIMIALLGVMIAVLTLIAGLLTFGIAALGIFGYQALRDELKKAASTAAQTTAEKIALQVMDDTRDRAQASGMSESQAEALTSHKPMDKALGQRTKATSDTGLKKETEEPL